MCSRSITRPTAAASSPRLCSTREASATSLATVTQAFSQAKRSKNGACGSGGGGHVTRSASRASRASANRAAFAL